MRFDALYFSYPAAVEPVLEGLSVEFKPGWTGITGDNGAGKTTLLLLAAGLLEASRGSVSGAGGIYCAQRTDDPPEFLADFFDDREAGRLRARLGLEADWPYRWDTLSHGERKRLQLGAALWRRPEILALDEPTNHLDGEARRLVSAALEDYSGTGLLVSHDRALLDGLCRECLFIRQGRALLRPGGISRGLAEEERETLEARRVRKQLFTERDRLAAEADKRRRKVEGSKNRLSKSRAGPRDNDLKGKIDLARLSGKDRTGADSYRRMENRLERLEQHIKNSAAPARRKEGITLETAAARMDRLCALAPGTIPLGGGRLLTVPELVIRPGDRIALTGPNGAGKSTLVRFLRERAAPRAAVLYLAQEVSAEESRALLEAVAGESEENRGAILARFSRLGSDPRMLLQSRLPSPGEVRKLLIAWGVFSNPALIIMDEPTNHLDLTSIRLLEDTLKEVSCALLLVSHDEVFLSALTT
ncbi:MAG: ATP-binding cassette domain-containing protein, partial [Spirochaetaceae bacterium]|nr:ATP-binding cassette domain-containing protein [Spirochaetaceae bacterium]